MYCSECRFFSDLGRCRNGAARRSDVGFFQKACDKFLPIQQPTKQQEPMAETKPAPAETEAPKTKHCSKCGRDLPLDAFGKKSNTKDGLQTWCKECQKASTLAARERRKNAQNKPQIEQKPGKIEHKPGEIEHAPAPAASTAKPKRNYLHYVSDEQLVAELKRRGYKGTIEMKKQFDIEA